MDELAVKKLLDYIAIDTVQPSPKYDQAIEFLRAYCAEISCLHFHTGVLQSGFPYALMTWNGTDPSLHGVLLNSHMDVVPFEEDKWKLGKPFGFKTSDGTIFGRGAQDMKSIGIQQVEAVRRLSSSGFTPRKTIYILFVPDEEVGGKKGMAQLCASGFFDAHKVGVAFDEGMPSPSDEYAICYEERYPYWLDFVFTGLSGHGSLPPLPVHAAVKFYKLFNQMAMIQQAEMASLGGAPTAKTIGSIITTNLTKIKGGTQPNIIPSRIDATFDVRVPPEKKAIFIETLEKLRGEIEFSYDEPEESTVREEAALSWVSETEAVLSQMGLKSFRAIMPGTTDMRYLRKLGIPALNFSPLNNTDIKLHDHDEYVKVDVLWRGIEIYVALLKKLAS